MLHRDVDLAADKHVRMLISFVGEEVERKCHGAVCGILEGNYPVQGRACLN